MKSLSEHHSAVSGLAIMPKPLPKEIEKRVKFLIVINEISLKDPRGDGIIKTINNFVNMFDLKGMNEDTKKLFNRSYSLLITKSEQH